MNVGRFDDALVAYQQAIEIDPTMPYPYSNLAVCTRTDSDDFDTPMPWFEKAASLDPGDPKTWLELAHAYWRPR